MPYDPFWRARPLQYVVEFLYSVALAIFSVLAFGIRGMACYVSEHRAENWPIANGTITTTNVKAVHGWFVDYALGQLGYTYTINGDYYSGYHTRQYADEQSAWTFVDARRNLPVLVRYKPSDVKVSMIREVDQGTSLLPVSTSLSST
jgi:hypothetical protein